MLLFCVCVKRMRQRNNAKASTDALFESCTVFMPSAQHSLTNNHFLTSCESLYCGGILIFCQLLSAFSTRILECSSHVHAESVTLTLILIISDFKQRGVLQKSWGWPEINFKSATEVYLSWGRGLLHTPQCHVSETSPKIRHCKCMVIEARQRWEVYRLAVNEKTMLIYTSDFYHGIENQFIFLDT